MLEWFTFEYKTVRSVRGTAGRSLAKFEAEGWELVSQESGAVRKTLKMRRARTRQGWLRIGGGVAAAVFLVAAIGVGAALEGDSAGRDEGSETSTSSVTERSATEGARAAPKAPTVASSRNLPMVWDTWAVVDNDIDVDSDLYGAFDPQFGVRNTGRKPADGYFTVTFLKDDKVLGAASCTTNLTLAGGEEVQPGGIGATMCNSEDRLIRGWSEITITSGESYDY